MSTRHFVHTVCRDSILIKIHTINYYLSDAVYQQKKQVIQTQTKFGRNLVS